MMHLQMNFKREIRRSLSRTEYQDDDDDNAVADDDEEQESDERRVESIPSRTPFSISRPIIESVM